MNKTITKQEAQDARKYMTFAKAVQANETIEDKGDLYEIVALPVKELPQIKTEKVISINQEYASRVSQVKATTVQEEVDTWDIQRLEALAWEADNNALTPQLDLIALHRGIDRVEMIQKTLAKTKAFETFVFTMLGQKQRLEDLVEQATTIEEVEAIVWE